MKNGCTQDDFEPSAVEILDHSFPFQSDLQQAAPTAPPRKVPRS